MKRIVLGLLVGVGLVMAAVAAAEQRGDVLAQTLAPTKPAAAVTPSSGMIVVPTSLGDKAQILTVIDPAQQVMCVYHIDLPTGKIALKSVRKIAWDLQINDFNNENPLPQEIRSRLEQR
jgi:hypothetical protein